ncbi:DUF305 domain-containing protein [Frankia sp. AgB1.9]|uniref:DUF305 domain-containing protein n=1 Tax=unclassified Frankia TaxID=2632575 RepID=UPI0019320893|nr:MULTISPECIES: DUF305 domain-containing protein [unclassified Frankia]MBL7492781.1 DUF305 domain-containing protein [Frankia sp. AgW1.1]MBL7549288.1 DUF305 domain-containing protein [Frankia sp. AgB1.9]MBL7619244.1 DUF305 domain-containing protein [Frankia sp. AgB1.8]
MKRLVLLFGGVLAAVVLAACGGTSTGNTANAATTTMGSGTAGADHNAADVTFTQDMIAHHEQAIEMADLADTRASSPAVKTLAHKIREAQAPEITTMTGWLTSWGEPTAAPSHSGGMNMPHSGMPSMPMTPMPSMPMASMPMATSAASIGGMSMGGMMSDEDLAKLRDAAGRDFDRMFLTMMIQHHRGAITMATTEQRDGRYGPAKQLATSIATSQTAEIATMQTLLQKN